MSSPDDLQLWGVAAGEKVYTIAVLCREHVSAVESDLPLGMHLFRVRARAWVRRARERARKFGAGRSECAGGAGRRLRLTDVGAVGAITRSELCQVGSET